MTDAPQALDWSKLAPNRPLGFNDPVYVPRPAALGTHGGERLAVLLRGAKRPIVVAGPAGAGKSTELAVAAGLLQKEWVACPVPLDRLLDVHRLTADEALNHAAGHLATIALSLLRIKLSTELKAELVANGVLNAKYAPEGASKAAVGGAELLLRTVREVRKIGRRGQVALFVDGLEKCPEATARDVTLGLLAMRDEIGLVIVAPPGLTTGPASYDVVSQVRVVPLRALPVMREPGAPWQSAREFFRAVVMKRLGLETLPMNMVNVLNTAAEFSGGVLKSYLQLVQDAAGYAAVHGRDALTVRDVEDAARDATDVMTCLLRDGDTASLREADGTAGIEVPLERRLRYLVHGLMLEYEVDGRSVVHPAPLLRLGGPASAR